MICQITKKNSKKKIILFFLYRASPSPVLDFYQFFPCFFLKKKKNGHQFFLICFFFFTIFLLCFCPLPWIQKITCFKPFDEQWLKKWMNLFFPLPLNKVWFHLIFTLKLYDFTLKLYDKHLATLNEPSKNDFWISVLPYSFFYG